MSKRRLRITERAERDLGEIWAYIAADSPGHATDFISKIIDRFKPLLINPEIGPARDALATGLRVQFHGNYAIYYTFTETELNIIRVLHGARDAAALFESGD